MNLKELFSEGLWEFRREIVHASGPCYSVKGTAHFKSNSWGPKGEWLERGRLLTPSQSVLVTRKYQFRHQLTKTLVVDFEGGENFFCLIDPEATQAKVQHLCGSDIYSGTFELQSASWCLTWRVQGPNKDYISRTQYKKANLSGHLPDSDNNFE